MKEQIEKDLYQTAEKFADGFLNEFKDVLGDVGEEAKKQVTDCLKRAATFEMKAALAEDETLSKEYAHAAEMAQQEAMVVMKAEIVVLTESTLGMLDRAFSVGLKVLRTAGFSVLNTATGGMSGNVGAGLSIVSSLF